MTPEDKARIARENGAKSRGPKTEAGKAQSRLNSIKTGDNAETLAQFVPPNSGILCHEDRKKFYALIHQLTQIYLPANQEAAAMVRQIAIARWQIDRLLTDLNSIWNHELMVAAQQPAPVTKDHEDDYYQAEVAKKLYTGAAPIEKMERQIDRLEVRIARLRRGIADINNNFPNVANPLETQDQEPQIENSEPTVYVTEPTPEVLAAYRREFPGHRIVVLPPDDVAKGIDIEDDLPPAPRRAA